MKVWPFVIHRSDLFLLVTNLKGVCKMWQKLCVSYVVDVVRKILDENGALLCTLFDNVLNCLQRQALCDFVALFETLPKWLLALIPGLSERFMETVQTATPGHHLFKCSRGWAWHGLNSIDFMYIITLPTGIGGAYAKYGLLFASDSPGLVVRPEFESLEDSVAQSHL